MNPDDYRYQVETLPNGLRLAWLNLPRARTVHFTAIVRGGCLYETKQNNGVSHLLEHLHMSTSRKYPTRDSMTEAIGRMGYANAYTFQDSLHFELGALPRQLAMAAELLAEILSPREFEPAEIELERALVLDELGGRSSNEPFVEFLYGGRPLAAACGTVRSVRSLKKSKLDQFEYAAFRPEHMVVGVVGELLQADVAAVSEALSGITPADEERLERCTINLRRLPAVTHSSSIAGPRAVCLGFLHKGPIRGPDWVSSYCLDRGLLNPPSPLFNQLRYGRTSAYNVSFEMDSYLQDVLLLLRARARTRHRRVIVEEVLAVLQTLRQGTMSHGWFTAMRDSAQYDLSKGLSHPVWLSWRIASGAYDDAGESGRDFAADVESLMTFTREHLQDFASRLFRPENAFILLGSKSWRCAPRHFRGMIEKYLG